MDGTGRSRVQDFLLSSLSRSAQDKYRDALLLLHHKCEEEGIRFSDLNEENQDWFLAEWILDAKLDGDKRWQYSELLSALARVNPRVRYRVSHRVLDVWTVQCPPKQAPAAPPELLVQIFMLLILSGHDCVGVGAMLCYAGLLRVREMLNLKLQDVVFGDAYIVVCLGQTKRGKEQKVCIHQPQVVAWLRAYVQSLASKTHERLFPKSYTTVLKWLRAASKAIGAEELDLTTHSLRRSGASELMRLGIPWPDIKEYGRWNSDRAARMYARQGEVAVYRARNYLPPQLLRRAAQWNQMSHLIWHGHLVVRSLAEPVRRRDDLTPAKVEAYHSLLCSLVAKGTA